MSRFVVILVVLVALLLPMSVSAQTGVALSGTAGSNGWWKSNVTVTFTTDTGGIQYSFDGANWMTYTRPLVLTESLTVYFHGQGETTQSVRVKIDCTLPVINVTTPEAYAVVPVGTALKFGATDGISGISALSATLDDGAGAVPVTNGDMPGPGVYTLSVEALDGAGNRTVDSRNFVVYDPEGGFVTGGGWFNSPAGAYVADPSLVGEATFGFVAKYHKGATIPTGQTAFQFEVANLDFYAESYDWLTVSGDRAQFKGTGTINGVGDYRFLLTAVNGTPDRFRIKIWETTEEVVYDNQTDTAGTTVLGGGSIVIHK